MCYSEDGANDVNPGLDGNLDECKRFMDEKIKKYMSATTTSTAATSTSTIDGGSRNIRAIAGAGASNTKGADAPYTIGSWDKPREATALVDRGRARRKPGGGGGKGSGGSGGSSSGDGDGWTSFFDFTLVEPTFVFPLSSLGTKTMGSNGQFSEARQTSAAAPCALVLSLSKIKNPYSG